MGKLVRVVIQLPAELKEQLDRLKQQGYTASGFIRAMLEREFAQADKEDEAQPRPAAKITKVVGM